MACVLPRSPLLPNSSVPTQRREVSCKEEAPKDPARKAGNGGQLPMAAQVVGEGKEPPNATSRKRRRAEGTGVSARAQRREAQNKTLALRPACGLAPLGTVMARALVSHEGRLFRGSHPPRQSGGRPSAPQATLALGKEQCWPREFSGFPGGDNCQAEQPAGCATGHSCRRAGNRARQTSRAPARGGARLSGWRQQTHSLPASRACAEAGRAALGQVGRHRGTSKQAGATPWRSMASAAPPTLIAAQPPATWAPSPRARGRAARASRRPLRPACRATPPPALGATGAAPRPPPLARPGACRPPR